MTFECSCGFVGTRPRDAGRMHKGGRTQQQAINGDWYYHFITIMGETAGNAILAEQRRLRQQPSQLATA